MIALLSTPRRLHTDWCQRPVNDFLQHFLWVKLAAHAYTMFRLALLYLSLASPNAGSNPCSNRRSYCLANILG